MSWKIDFGNFWNKFVGKRSVNLPKWWENKKKTCDSMKLVACIEPCKWAPTDDKQTKNYESDKNERAIEKKSVANVNRNHSRSR